MINSTYAPKRFEDLNADGCMLNEQGVQDTVTAGQTTFIDLTLTDDHLLTGLQISANGTSFGDTINLQVVDKGSMLQNLYGSAITTMYPNYPVLRQFGTNIALCSDQQFKIEKEKMYPAKVIGGLTLRVIYHSIGSTNVNVAVNYELHKVMF